MPFPNTSGFESQVMPAVQFQNPALYGGLGQAIQSGVAGATDVMGALQRQRQLAAMNPLLQQEAQNTIETQRRALMQPILIKTGETLENRPNPDANVDPDSYKDAIAQGMTPEKAREVSMPPEDQQVADQYKVEHYKKIDPVTGKSEDVTIPSLFKSAEQVNLEREQAQRYMMMGQYYSGRNVANVTAAQVRAGAKPQSVMQDDGHLHFVTRQLNPDTQQMEEVVGGIDADTESKIALNAARGKHETALADVAAEGPGMSAAKVASRAQATNLAKSEAALAIPADILKQLYQTTDGQQVVAARTAHRLDPINSPDFITDPALLATYRKAEAAARAPKASTVPVVGVNLGSALGAMAPTEPAAEGAAAPAGRVNMFKGPTEINGKEPTIGKTYTDKDGNSVKYFGNGIWQNVYKE